MKNSNLKRHIGYWLSRLQIQSHKGFEQRLKKYNITVAEWCILISIHDKQGNSITTLAKYIEVNKSAISRLVEQLSKRNLVIIMEGRDRRSSEIHMTKEAQILTTNLLNEADINDQDFFGNLNKTELMQLKNIFNKLFLNNDSINPSGWLSEE